MAKAAASKTIHPWSHDAFLTKAQRYAQEMLTYSRDDWRFGLTSTFVLEFIARAALANVSPVLLAEAKDWNNLYFALGRTPTAQKFLPRSISTTVALSRLREIYPTFTQELEGFAAQHLNRRNEELHAGSVPFDGLKTAWLANFYLTCTVLLKTMNENLTFLVGAKEAQIAKKLVAALLDQSAKTVMKSIHTHKTLWKAMNTADRGKAIQQASIWATRQAGHRVACPACGNDALVTGAPISEPLRKLNGDLIIETQEYLPSKFECIACKLKIAGLSQIGACGLGSTYKATFTYDAAEYYAQDDQYAGFDDDNNEY